MTGGFDDTTLLLPEVLASHGRNRPDRIALVCDGESLSWGAFNNQLNQIANKLLERGVKKGDRVAVLVSSSIAACVAMFGTVKSGAALVPVSSMLTGEQVRVILTDCQASHLFCSADLRHLVDPIVDELPDLTARVGMDFEGNGWVSIAQFCGDMPTEEPDVLISGQDVFNVMYSSGTTGAPKGVVHTHSARTYFSVSNGLEMRFDPDSRSLLTTALFTAGTWIIMLPTLFVGGTVHIHRRYIDRQFVDALKSERITHSFTVPSQLRTLMSEGLLDNADFPHLKVLLSAGSPLRPEEKTQLIANVGSCFYELYGNTEGSSTLLRPEDQKRKPLSVGKPLFGQEILTINGDDQPCGPGELGEIVGRGPGSLRAYLGRPDETEAAIWRDARGRSYIRSGDVGRFDEDGFLYIAERKKDMIISGGLNVFPADIEAVLAVHDDVADVCVIGIDHARWGETPLAFVVAIDGASVSSQELLEWANARLGKHQRLSGIIFHDALPRNAMGKVLKRELRDDHAAGRFVIVNGADA